MKKAAIVLVLLVLLTQSVSASEILEQQIQEFGANSVLEAAPDAVGQITGDIQYAEDLDVKGWLQKTWDQIREESATGLRSAGITMLKMMGILMICCLMDGVAVTPNISISTLAGVIGMTLCCTNGLQGIWELAKDTMDEIRSFSLVLLPVMASAAAASGAASGATVLYSATVLFSGLLTDFCNRILLPIISAGMALAVAGTALHDNRLQGLQDLVFWILRFVLKGGMYIYTGFLAIGNVITGAVDSSALKAAKLTISSVVPVVGGIISDAAGSVLAGAQLLKSVLGTLGMLSFLSIFVIPFVRIGIQYLLLRLTMAMGMLLGSKLTGILDTLSKCVGYLLAMTASCLMMNLLSCFCFMKTVQM